jgi:hypothetical protein
MIDDFLDKLRDRANLISTEHITLDSDGYMYVEEQLVQGTKENQRIIDILKKYPALWAKSKFLLKKRSKKTIGSGGASIIGIPFSHGIENVIAGKPVQQSMFYIDDDVTDKGLEGRLIADYRKTGQMTKITFQLWEVLPLDLPTYYIHGIYDITSRVFEHFDGALIYMDSDTKEKMKWKFHIPSKKFEYTKLFRLDGKISTEIARELMFHYLPLEDLSREYGLYPPIKEKIRS